MADMKMQIIKVPASIKDFKDLRDYADIMHRYLTADEVTQEIVSFALNLMVEKQEKSPIEYGSTDRAGSK